MIFLATHDVPGRGRAASRRLDVSIIVDLLPLSGATMARRRPRAPCKSGSVAGRVGILPQTEGIEEIVHDITGLEGLFDIEVPAYPKGQPRSGEPIASVVQKQHGLKLERRRVQGRFLQIDGIRQPSPN